jgi:hypothetical protein
MLDAIIHYFISGYFIIASEHLFILDKSVPNLMMNALSWTIFYLQKAEFWSITFMIFSFIGLIFIRRKSLKENNFLIDAIAIALLAKEIPIVFLIILSAYNPNFLNQVTNLSSTLALIGLVLIYYIYRIFSDKFKLPDSS